MVRKAVNPEEKRPIIMMKVAINGFDVLDVCPSDSSDRDDVEIVAINDPASTEMLAYLLKHDGVQGRLLQTQHTMSSTFMSVIINTVLAGRIRSNFRGRAWRRCCSGVHRLQK